jgi:SWI/SNF-related matrix-associated actin-dependent regulator of chromatin subfamily A-like protein 1
VLSVEKVAMYANFPLPRDFIQEMRASFDTVFDPDHN